MLLLAFYANKYLIEVSKSTTSFRKENFDLGIGGDAVRLELNILLCIYFCLLNSIY